MGFQRISRKQTTTIAYLRVSTTDQDLEKNRAHILHLANEKDLGRVQWVEETIPGRVSWKRRKIAPVIEELGVGDTLIVSALSRLGRSMLECMEILSIASRKGIHIYAVKGSWQQDGTIQSKIVAMAFSMGVEIERDLISQRTKEALSARKRAGMKLGRPREWVRASWTNTDQRLRPCWPTAPPRSTSTSATAPRSPTRAIG